jgi:hypothetical protein
MIALLVAIAIVTTVVLWLNGYHVAGLLVGTAALCLGIGTAIYHKP